MLYSHQQSKDSCGFGLIADLKGRASHMMVERSLEALICMTHRGGIAADGKTGDGCGLMVSLPEKFFRKTLAEHNRFPEYFAVGMVFCSSDTSLNALEHHTIERLCQAHAVPLCAWRPVPVQPNVLGALARAHQPTIMQFFVEIKEHLTAGSQQIMVVLYKLRKAIERALKQHPNFYISSLSHQTITYKALTLPHDLSRFYLDLSAPDFEARLCLFHQRFSTNTLPQWALAQPFRYLAHNGEINTIRANRQWAQARIPLLKNPWLPELSKLEPIVSTLGSDSQSLDNMLEYLLVGGMDIHLALRFLIPPPWQNVEMLDPDLRAFYEYQSIQMEPWDGPAGIVIADGKKAICVLDRNGLRPTRWVETDQGWITIASEIGVWGYQPQEIVRSGRMHPGDMIVIDTECQKMLFAEEIDQTLAQRHPYRQWLRSHSIRIESRLEAIHTQNNFLEAADLVRHECLHLVSFEEKKAILKPLALYGQEATGSMGDDTPIAVLSEQLRPWTDYFRQQFAQVTNPPIDPLRESIVMSLVTCLGVEQNIFHKACTMRKKLF